MISKEEVLETIKKHLLNTLPDLTEAEFDPERSMTELGANSLDIVDVVSCTLRDLQIKVPRAQLVGLENIDGFANMILQTAMQAEAAS